MIQDPSIFDGREQNDWPIPARDLLGALGISASVFVEAARKFRESYDRVRPLIEQAKRERRARVRKFARRRGRYPFQRRTS